MARIRAVPRAYPRQGPSAGVVELKFHDVDLDDALIATGGTITPSINLIPQGVTEIQRLGRKCTLKSINWRYNLELTDKDAGSVVSVSDTVRLIVYLDKQTNGLTATVTDILESADYQSFNNLVNRGRFLVLMDRVEDVNVLAMASDGTGLMSNSANRISRTFFKKCDIPLEFSAATGALTEIRSNNIGVLAISTAGTISLDSKFRLRFIG